MLFARPTTTADHRRWLGGVGLLGVTLIIVLLVGWPGLLLGGVLAVSWRRLPPEYTFALGQFALVMGLPTAQPLSSATAMRSLLLGLGEAGLLVLLLAPPADTDRPLTRSGITVLATVLATGTFVGWWSVHWLDSLWIPVAGGIVVATLVIVGLKHYEYMLHTASRQ